MTNPLSRRTFLSSASAAAAAGATQLSAKSYARIVGANDRIGVSVIGGGVIGNAHFGVINKPRNRTIFFPLR